jgi:hypothetical protein
VLHDAARIPHQAMVESVFFAEDFAAAAIDAATWRKSHMYPATTTARKHFLRLIIDKPCQNVSAMCRHFVSIPRKNLLVQIQLESDEARLLTRQ